MLHPPPPPPGSKKSVKVFKTLKLVYAEDEEENIVLTGHQNKSPVSNNEPFFVLASQHQLTHSLHYDDNHERLLPSDPPLS